MRGERRKLGIGEEKKREKGVDDWRKGKGEIGEGRREVQMTKRGEKGIEKGRRGQREIGKREEVEGNRESNLSWLIRVKME